MFTVTVTYGSIVSFIPVFTQKQGINPGTFFSVYAAKYGIPYSGSDLAAAAFLTVFAITLILVRALAGKLSDIKGRKFVIIPGMVLITLGLSVLSISNSLLIFLAAALLYGLGFGFVHPTMMALLVDFVSERGRSAAMATFTAAFDLGIGTGSIVLGVVLQFFGFKVMYLLSGLVVLIGTIWFISVNDKKRTA
jgi:MFS family permease